MNLIIYVKMGSFIILILIVIAVSLVVNLSSEKRVVASETERMPSKEHTVSADTQADVIDSDTTQVDTVGERAKSVLTQQGIPVTIDEDGDICFEYHFRNYLLEEANSTDFFRLSVSIGVEIDEQNMMRFLKVANQLHIQYRMIRMACFEEGIKFSVETVLYPELDLKHLLSFSLFLLETSVVESRKLYEKEKQSDSTIDFHEAQELMLEGKRGNESGKKEPVDKELSKNSTPSIGFNSSRYRV